MVVVSSARLSILMDDNNDATIVTVVVNRYCYCYDDDDDCYHCSAIVHIVAISTIVITSPFVCRVLCTQLMGLLDVGIVFLLSCYLQGPTWAQQGQSVFGGLLGGSWVAISGVISPLIRVISIVALLKAPSYIYP